MRYITRIIIVLFITFSYSYSYSSNLIEPEVLNVVLALNSSRNFKSWNTFAENNYKIRNFKLPENFLNRIYKEYRWIIGRKSYYDKIFLRGSKWINLIDDKLIQNKIPAGIAELALIESHFQPYAKSDSGAVGMWQLERKASEESNIHINFFTDDRLNPSLSTYAAINYLKQLHRTFGSWLIAISAYNAGPGAISRLLKKSSFYDILEKNRLPMETIRYIAKYIAIQIAIDNGVFRYDPDNIYRVVLIKTHIPFYFIARIVGISTRRLFRLNRFLKHEVMPPEQKRYPIIIPQSNYKIFVRNYADLIKKNPRKLLFYKVKRYDSYRKIANFFWLRKSTIERVRRRAGRLYNGKIIRIPWYLTQKRVAMLYYKGLPVRYEKYQVKRGDSLLKIARRFGVTVASIRAVNKIRGSLIRTDQVILLRRKL